MSVTAPTATPVIVTIKIAAALPPAATHLASARIRPFGLIGSLLGFLMVLPTTKSAVSSSLYSAGPEVVGGPAGCESGQRSHAHAEPYDGAEARPGMPSRNIATVECVVLVAASNSLSVMLVDPMAPIAGT